MIRYKHKQIKFVAKRLTHNSELYHDELDSVICQLTKLSESANKYGCAMSGVIHTCYGAVPVTVQALPDTKQHSWSFPV